MNANQLHKISVPNSITCIGFICCLFTILLVATAILFTPSRVQAEECGTWEQIPHPFLRVGAIIANEPNQVWVVGNSDPMTATTSTSMIARWNETDWNVVASYQTPIAYHYLESLAKVLVFSDDDIWRIGTTYSGPFHWGWARHWDGFGWTEYILSSSGSLQVHSGSGISSNNLWVVAWDDIGPGSSDRLLHWNGAKWKTVQKKLVTQKMALSDIYVLGLNNIWIVGSRKAKGMIETLAIHRNQTDWQVIPSPNMTGLDTRLGSVDAGSAKSVWAVGFAGDSPNIQSVVQRWNGKKWKMMPAPNAGYLAKVAVVANKNVWVHNNNGIYNWNGEEWILTFQVPHPDEDIISDIVALSSGEMWATASIEGQGVILRFQEGLPPCPITSLTSITLFTNDESRQ